MVPAVVRLISRRSEHVTQLKFKKHRLADRVRDWAYTPGGVPVWSVIADFRAGGCNAEATPFDADELRFALEYYAGHQAEIDQKLATL
jgi:hypothetical protein